MVNECKSAPPPVIERAKVIPMTTIRKTIAERMKQSHLTAVHVTITTEVNMTEAAKFRKKLLSEIEIDANACMSYTDILVKAVAEALKEHRIVNSRLEGERIKILEDINVGVAIATESGLVVPVIHNADKKSLTEIALVTKELIEKARKGTLTLKEVIGGTFTVTNLGMLGVDTFTPIINPPESAILGVGRIVERPVVVDGQIVARLMMPLSLSFDHRVIDGAIAAQFLQTLRQILENPCTLTLTTSKE